jgi:hypothetical protein
VPDVRVASVITALLIVAAVSTIYVQRTDRQSSSQPESPTQRTAQNSPEAVAFLETHDVRAAASAASAEAAPALRSIDLPSPSPADGAKSTATAADVASRVQGGPVAGTVASASRTGRPFPVSKSVRSDCEGESAGVGICVEVIRLLKKFAEEPRDVNWATDMEARIRAFVDGEAGKFAIRTLECRTSVCAVEVESIYGPYMGVDYQTQLDSGVEDSVASFGDEEDAQGQDVTITLRLIERD